MLGYDGSEEVVHRTTICLVALQANDATSVDGDSGAATPPSARSPPPPDVQAKGDDVQARLAVLRYGEGTLIDGLRYLV